MCSAATNTGWRKIPSVSSPITNVAKRRCEPRFRNSRRCVERSAAWHGAKTILLTVLASFARWPTHHRSPFSLPIKISKFCTSTLHGKSNLASRSKKCSAKIRAYSRAAKRRARYTSACGLRSAQAQFFNLLTTILPLQHGNKQYHIQILDDITARKRAEQLGKKFQQTVAHHTSRR